MLSGQRTNQEENFPTMRENTPEKGQSYPMDLSSLREQFANRFGDFRACRGELSSFGTPLEVDVNDVPAGIQVELVELQCSSDLKAKICESKLLTFYEKYVPHDSFPQLVKM